MSLHEGRCLCGAVQYATHSGPIRVTTCHSKFCQRATGAPYFIEPIFKIEDLEITAGTPRTFLHRSEGSGKMITVNFCAVCGTKIYLGFERFPEYVGVYAGTFDDPNWFEIRPENSKQIFLEAARHGTIIPPGFVTYRQHATHNDGTAIEPKIFDQPHVISP